MVKEEKNRKLLCLKAKESHICKIYLDISDSVLHKKDRIYYIVKYKLVTD